MPTREKLQAVKKVPAPRSRSRTQSHLPRRPSKKKSPAYFKFWEKLHQQALVYIPTTTESRAGHRHLMQRKRSGVIENGFSMQSWSGSCFDSPGTGFTRVAASWTIPNEICPTGAPDGSRFFCSIWVGIGGMNNDPLVQAGTEFEITCQQGTATNPQLYCWYELAPGQEQVIQHFPINPGDNISLIIQLQPGGQHQYIAWFVNNSTLGHTSHPIPFNPNNAPGNSVEWIVERPLDNGITTDLANFGVITFVGMTALTDQGAELQGGNGQPIFMTLNDHVTEIADAQAVPPSEVIVSYQSQNT